MQFVPTTLTLDSGVTRPPPLLSEADLLSCMDKVSTLWIYLFSNFLMQLYWFLLLCSCVYLVCIITYFKYSFLTFLFDLLGGHWHRCNDAWSHKKAAGSILCNQGLKHAFLTNQSCNFSLAITIWYILSPSCFIFVWFSWILLLFFFIWEGGACLLFASCWEGNN